MPYPRNRELAERLGAIVDELRPHWPLTVRQCYYRLVAALLVPNELNAYRRVSRLLTKLRREGAVPWDAIEDRTRRTVPKRGMEGGVDRFIDKEMDGFLHPSLYRRCYVQSQSVYIELASEKDALASILVDAVRPYCTRLNVVRGQVSATMVRDMAERFEAAAHPGILLYAGDFDYTGAAIPRALVRNMAEHHRVDVELRRIALNPDQIERYALPEDPDAGKPKDPNRDAFIAEYGNRSPVELDALHPDDLQAITREALEDAYDMALFAEEQAEELRERKKLTQVRGRALAAVEEALR